jgi:hypothetical protein
MCETGVYEALELCLSLYSFKNVTSYTKNIYNMVRMHVADTYVPLVTYLRYQTHIT